MSDYPERISISPVHRQKHDDDFYLVDRKAFPGKGTEYVRADRIEELEAKLAKAVEFIQDLTGCEWPYDEDAKRTLAELKGEAE